LSIRKIDIPRTHEERLEHLLKWRMSLGKADFDKTLKEIEQEAQRIEKQRECDRQKRIEESNRERALRNTPLNKFIHALKLRRVAPEILNTWRDTPPEIIRQVYEEFSDLKKRRGLALPFDVQDFGTSFLVALMNKNGLSLKEILREKFRLS